MLSSRNKVIIIIIITIKERSGERVSQSIMSIALRERLRIHKVFTKYQCFYLNYHKFSIKSYVLDVY